MSLSIVSFISFPPIEINHEDRELWVGGRNLRSSIFDPLPSILYLRSSIFVIGGLVNLLLSDLEFGADDAHRQHHLFFRAFAFGDFGQPLSLTFAAMMDAETGDDQQNGHCARRRPFHLRRLKKLRESSQPARFLPRLFPLL